jgi:uncharacterized DUF497 family protein
MRDITLNPRAIDFAISLRQESTLIRVISARDQHRKERNLYGKARKNSASDQTHP